MKHLLTQIPRALTQHTKFIPMLGIVALVAAVPVTLNLIQQNQDIRQQAAEPDFVSNQQNTQDPSASSSAGTCASVGGECMTDAEWLSTQSLFAAAATDLSTYTCPTDGHVCKVQDRATADNQTCTGSCDFNSIGVCEGEGGTVTGDSCFNRNVCCSMPTSTTPNIPPLGSPCSDGSGNFSCGFGTSDTQCPVCSPIATCSTDNYSIAECSGIGACNVDGDCANKPPSCPAGQSGQVVCQKAPNQQQGTCVTVSCQ